MLNMYVPTIEKPTEQHADWYKGFCTAFNLCQLSNYLLISYLKSYVQAISTPIIVQQPIYKESVGKCKTQDEHDDLIISLDIVDFLNQIIGSFSNIHKDHKEKLLFMGLDIQGFHNQEISINLNEIKESTTADNWHKIIKGLINIFEFLYLFSIVEDYLKEVVNETKSGGIVGKALKIRPGFIEHLNTELKFSRNFIIKLWEFFLELRNIYSHSFGHFQEMDKTQILEKRNIFIEAYDNLSIDWHMTAQDTDEYFFPPEKIIPGKMYLVNDSELNVFRNFVRLFVPELAKWSK